MTKLETRIDFPTDAEVERLFDAAGAMNRFAVGDKVVRGMAGIVLARARELAPRSSKTGSTKRWIRKLKDARESVAELWRSLAMKVKKTNTGAYALAGPKYPEGSKAYFNVAYKKGSRSQVLWGRRTGVQVLAIRNWMLQAFDETKAAQLAKAKDVITAFLKAHFGG